MSKTKCPPYIELGGHEIRVFELSCGSKKSLDPVEMPKGGSAGGAIQFNRGPKLGLGQGKADDLVEVPRKIGLQQSRSRQISLIWTARRYPAQFITVITEMTSEKKKLRTERKKTVKKKKKEGTKEKGARNRKK
jgi:hypothetical protein